MTYSTLNPVQVFKHNGYPFRSNDSAKLIYYGTIYCIVLLLE